MSATIYSSSAVLARTVPLTPSAQAVLRPDWTPRQCLEALRSEGLHVDCLRYLPHLLDRHRAVWWACLCCFDAYGDGVTPALADALTRTLRWLHAPTEANRMACLDDDGFLSVNSAENCLRMAVYWSAGSVVPETLPEVLPPPDATPQLCTGAALIAAASGGMFAIAERHRRYVDLGQEVLEGRLTWTADDETVQAPATVAIVA